MSIEKSGASQSIVAEEAVCLLRQLSTISYAVILDRDYAIQLAALLESLQARIDELEAALT